MDLMEMVKSAINNQATGQIATALGTDAQTASKAISTALPAILGGLVKQASTQTGASNLFGALDKIDTSILDNLGAALSGGKLQSVIEAGTKLLPAVFGSNFSSVFGTLGKLTGLGSGKMGPLLGMLVSIVMSVLAKAKQTAGLDLSGFSRMLMDQKKNLSGIDSGLANQLGLGQFADVGAQTMEYAGRALPKVAESLRPAVASGGATISRWLIPLLGLLAVALGLYVFVLSRDRGEVTTPTNTGSQSPPATLTPGRPAPAPKSNERPAESPAESSTENATKKITDFISDASKALTEIKDEAGAKTAAESLHKLAEKVDSLGLDKLAGTAKTIAGAALKKFVDEAKAWAEKAYATPGVKEVLEPGVNAVVEKLKGFAE